MMKTTHRTLQTGPLALNLEVDAAGRLRGVKLPKKVPADLDAATLAQAIAELQKYELAAEGPPFMQKVWKEMAKIPWGSALTYAELAAAAGSPKAVRATGQACATNPLPLIIPCHRVLANEGPGGFGFGPEWKAKLLELESEPQPQP
jgi:O-6-methylguanine DNA methyltransferase